MLRNYFLLFGMAVALSGLINASAGAEHCVLDPNFNGDPNCVEFPPLSFSGPLLFDFQGSNDTAHAGEDAPGATIITPDTPLYSPCQGYGFYETPDGGRNRGGTDLFLKDFIFVDAPKQLNFRVDLPNGIYGVKSWEGDMDFARGSVRMILSFDGGCTEDVLYGSDGSSPDNLPLPGTFMTTFADSGSPGVFDQIIPIGKQALGANYRMEATEYLQVITAVKVINGSLTFMIASGDRILNQIEIVELDTCEKRIAYGAGVPGDTNADCHADMIDFSVVASDWMQCNDPNNPACI